MKNSAGRGGCYPPRPKAEVDNILRDLQNSSYPTKAESNNSFVIHSKYFQTLKGENELYLFLTILHSHTIYRSKIIFTLTGIRVNKNQTAVLDNQ